MCVFGYRPKKMLYLPGPKGWKPLKVPNLDDISFGIIGWRIWYPSFSRSAISGNFSQTWYPDKSIGLLPKYGKKNGNRTVLSRNGSEGVYAYKREERLFPGVTNLYGEVLLWGSIAEYPTGYRAQYAYPLSFFIRDTQTAKSLEPWTDYGVYINILSKGTEGADKYGYIEYA